MRFDTIQNVPKIQMLIIFFMLIPNMDGLIFVIIAGRYEQTSLESTH